MAEEQAGASLQGPPSTPSVYEIVNQAARGRRSGGRGEGELTPPPSLVSKPFAFQAQMLAEI